jgi:hypothetical protein
MTACANLINSQPVFIVLFEQLQVFAFRAAVLVLLLEVLESLNGKVPCSLIVLSRNEFHDARSTEHQCDIEERDPLVHFHRQAKNDLDQAHSSGI